MCDYEAEIHGVAGGWPHYFYKEDKAQGAAWKERKLTELEKMRLEGAVIMMAFASPVASPVRGGIVLGIMMRWLPTSSYGLYNSVKA